MADLNQQGTDRPEPGARPQRPRGLAAARVTALAASVMDLHVRIALQEVDREKRRLISGGVFLAMGGTLMLLALIAAEAALLVLWLQEAWDWSLIQGPAGPGHRQRGAGRHQPAGGWSARQGPLSAPDPRWHQPHHESRAGALMLSARRSGASGSRCRHC